MKRYSRHFAKLAIGAALFLGGYLLGALHPARPAHAQDGTPEELEALFAPFWEVWDRVHDTFVYQPLDDEALVEGAIQGMLEELDDPYTEYLSPEAYALTLEDMSGEFEGIGAEVSQDEDGALIIVAPMAGSPAEAAGLLPGDRVIAVNGQDIRDSTFSEISLMVRGPAGTSVTLTVDRPGEPGTFDVTIVRALIALDYVDWAIIDQDILYIRLAAFGTGADTELHDALSEAITPEINGIILDMRANPGGWVDTAMAITEEFVPDGVLLIQRDGDGTEHVYESEGDGLAYDLPLVVLIDEGSASASEVLAGAIQAHARGTIVGSRSFGKGTVQILYALGNGGGLRVTTSQWLTPDERWIHGYGIAPDIHVDWPAPRRPNEPDPELEAAIAVLRGYSIWPNWPLTWLDWPSMRSRN
jgi:carboxyl-terminal processing protease